MNSRSSFVVRFARYIQRAPLWILRFIEWPFIKLYGEQCDSTKAIFILALPRSGSTLTYQTICHGLKVNYLSNIWNMLYHIPLLGGYISYCRAKNHASDFKSVHGFVPGIFGPAEGLSFWKYWLDCGLTETDCNSTSPIVRARRANYLRYVLSILGEKSKPFASAYLGHVLVPDRLNHFFPGSVFIRLKRNPIYNALSILNAIKDDNSDWFSVLPKECESKKNFTIYEKVASQVYWLNRRLDDAVCSTTMLTIQYEDLCNRPEYELERVRLRCIELGLNVEHKYNLPEKFPMKKIDEKNNSDFIKLSEAFHVLEAKFGKLE